MKKRRKESKRIEKFRNGGNKDIVGIYQMRPKSRKNRFMRIMKNKRNKRSTISRGRDIKSEESERSTISYRNKTEAIIGSRKKAMITLRNKRVIQM